MVIKKYCDPNALSTFTEYLQDYACPETRHAGEKAIGRVMAACPPDDARQAQKMMDRVRRGERDVYF